MGKITQREQLLQAWVNLSGILKNNRITKGLMYNEAVVMLLLYNRYREDGIGLISIKEITKKTRMLKSLVNRTINLLEEKGLLERCKGSGDSRLAYVRCIEQSLDIFLKVHETSLTLAQNIIDIIGEKDAETFISIVKKIEAVDYKLS